jgi:hypothetical protein
MRLNSSSFVRLMGVALAASFWFAAAAVLGEGLTARLDPDTIHLGESAQLALQFEDCQPSTVPALPRVPGLNATYAGQGTSLTIDNGRQSMVLSLNYLVTASQPGVFTIPAIRVNVNGKIVSSSPVTLRVLKANEQAPAAAGQSEPALLKLIPAKTTIYLGEVLPLDVQLYYANAQDVQLDPLPADGFTSGKSVTLPQQQVRLGNRVYLLATVRTTVTATRLGDLKIGPAECRLNLRIPVARQRTGNPMFDDLFDDPFFGQRYQLQPRTLTSEAPTIHVLPLPAGNVPASFAGAVGSFTFSATASPTNVAIGEPITLTVRITGQGALDNVTLPPLNQWSNFKVYPPTSQVETTDQLGVEGTKTFQQVVVPESLDVKELPALAFSYFDPATRSYHTLTQPAVPVVVRPSAGGPSLTTANASGAPAGAPTDIVSLKVRLGTLSRIAPPLIQQPWFLALQTVPVLTWLGAVIWRRRRDHLARNPQLVRRQLVSKQLKRGLAELARQADANDADAFFALVFRLLQEGLGERLSLPAASITEAVLDEHLQPRGVDAALLAAAHELFQACNQQRYAPGGTRPDLAALVPKVESTLLAIGQLKL